MSTSSPVMELLATRRDGPRLKRILLADDEHLSAQHVAMQLSDLGYQVSVAKNGAEALTLAKEMRPDLAVLDIRMPQQGGLDIARELYEQGDIPVVILSAYSEDQEITRAAEAGVFGYLIKPSKPEQLKATLEVAWSMYLTHTDVVAEAEKLHQRLEDRKWIEQAKWLLVSRRGMTEPDASLFINRQARGSRRTMGEIAKGILAEYGTPIK